MTIRTLSKAGTEGFGRFGPDPIAMAAAMGIELNRWPEISLCNFRPTALGLHLRRSAMARRRADFARVIAATFAIGLDAAPSAHADEPCARVVTPADLTAAWSSAVADLRNQIAQLPASDCQPMTLSLEPAEEGMRIVAVTPDGRRAERTARHSESLMAVVLGLIMTIPRELPGPPVAPVSSMVPALVDPNAPPPATPPPATAATTAPPRPSGIGLWAGLSGGVRLTAPLALSVLDVEARADIVFDSWLMLVTLRSALVSCLGQQGIDCDVYNDVSIGAGVGRRFKIGGPEIDVGIEPNLAVMRMEYDTVAGAESQAIEGTEAVLRFDLSARLAVPVDRHWVLTVILDGGVVPSLLARPTGLALPAGGPAGEPPPPPRR
jgi:hypothetical protein